MPGLRDQADVERRPILAHVIEEGPELAEGPRREGAGGLQEDLETMRSRVPRRADPPASQPSPPRRASAQPAAARRGRRTAASTPTAPRSRSPAAGSGTGATVGPTNPVAVAYGRAHGQAGRPGRLVKEDSVPPHRLAAVVEARHGINGRATYRQSPEWDGAESRGRVSIVNDAEAKSTHRLGERHIPTQQSDVGAVDPRDILPVRIVAPVGDGVGEVLQNSVPPIRAHPKAGGDAAMRLEERRQRSELRRVEHVTPRRRGDRW